MKEKLILVGRVMDGNRLVGGKFVNLQTLESIFMMVVDFQRVFKSYDVVNCKYVNQGLRNKNKYYNIKYLSTYSKNCVLKSVGVYSDSELIAMELHVDPDSITIRICGALVCGAISNPFSDEAECHAIMYYKEIRKMRSDVYRIAANVNVPVKDIIRIKNYLFMEQHLLNGEVKYFDESFHIAQSWQRLMSKDGRDIKPHDITLIKHELYEMQLVDSGMSQSEAHDKVSLKYNYSLESFNYYASLLKK